MYNSNNSNNPVYNNKQRISQKQKNANDFQWYKDQALLLNKNSIYNNMGFGGVSEYKRKKVNYDLFNNILNMSDLTYVCKPFGDRVGELPANFANRDIVSGKIKVLLGMEMKMPFSWKVVAVNEEATTRKEEEETSRIREYVVSEAMKPIKVAIEKQLRESTQGRKLTPEEEASLKQQIDEQAKAQTPDEVRVYMARTHQDPAEALARQILEYLTQEKRLNFKFNKGWKHSTLSGQDLYWVGIRNGEPDCITVNPLFFENEMSSDSDFVEDGEWATYEMRMTPSGVVAAFGSQLTEEQIDRIYNYDNSPAGVADIDFTFNDAALDQGTVRVKHFNWKSLQKIGFLSFVNNDGKVDEDIVNEDYVLNRKHGDIRIEWEWVPQAHECYQILDDIFVYCRPVPGQNKNIDNLWKCKLSYFGAVTDALNSPVTSPMDRMKYYQYLYNIIIYRIELLMAADKGKILMMNIKAIPKSAGIDMTKFMYFMEANKIGYLNPNEEGLKGGGDITNMVKEIDMSLISDIKKYIDLAEYIDRRCGLAIGVTPQMEAQIGPTEAVSNTRQNLVQASYIIQPYFELHNIVKGNVLQALIDVAKIAYSESKPRKLSYILDDMSLQILTIDQELLENSDYGLFVSNSAKASDAKQAVENLAQAALQNQQIDLSDIIKVIKADSINEAEELLEASQSRKQMEAQQTEQDKLKQQQDMQQQQLAQIERGWKHEEDMIVLKEKERRKTEVQKQLIMSMGFDPNKDEDEDGEPDILEVAKHNLDTEIKMRKQNLDEDKFNHQQKVDKTNEQLQREKLAIDRKKAANKPSSSSK